MIDLNGFEEYLRLVLKESTVTSYKNYIKRCLEILNKIDEFKPLSDEEKLIEFSKKDDYQTTYDKYHNLNEDTFSDHRSAARKYKSFLRYKKIREMMKQYDEYPKKFPLNGAYMFFRVFNEEKSYPIKALCRPIRDYLGLPDNFTTVEAIGKLKKIFGKNNIKIIKIIEGGGNMDIKNIILYGPPGVGKTHNYQRLISSIEEGKSLKDIFEIIKKNDKVKLNNETYKNIENEGRVKFLTFHQSYSYEDFIEGFRPNEEGKIELQDGIFKKICKEASENKDNKYYLIIDEINRGNISKIFGELITLIEEDKRDNYEVILPYSKKPFKIPSNIFIIGTLNSTDKSIATIDIALRRRFTFIKMLPNPKLANPKAKKLMEKLNEFIKNNLSEDYQIGHSYFMRDDLDLEFVIEYKIKPLIEEYFYGDDEKIEEAMKIITDLMNEEITETINNG